jgi:cysteinyl-tRNA synthetase
MFPVYFTNTLTRKKELFKPGNPPSVSMYQCGPTVYWTQHIGNLRAAVMGDVVVRSLEYLGYEVKLVRNYTDVGHLTSDEDEGEDKMEKGARREGVSPEEIAQKYIDRYERDIAVLHVSMPAVCPRATNHIADMIALTEKLVAKGFAYATPLAIYFDVSKTKDYTKLSGQNPDELRSGAGTGDVVDPEKKNARDFALWFFKAGVHANALQTWHSPFESPIVEHGEGFPGWHIECSAMSEAYLGETLDIHMGGVEHISVHHTNEIAQSEAAHDGAPHARVWLHNEHLTVNGKKMAKSEGTSYSLEEVEEKSFSPLALRYFFLQAHYRSKQNFTWEALDAASRGLENVRKAFRALPESTGAKADTASVAHFAEKLADDVNVPQALAIFHEVLGSDMTPEVKRATLLDMDRVLGLGLVDIEPEEKKDIPEDILARAKERDELRAQGDYTTADEIRNELQEKGYDIKDTPEGGRVERV